MVDGLLPNNFVGGREGWQPEVWSCCGACNVRKVAMLFQYATVSDAVAKLEEPEIPWSMGCW
jgi:hypothetical protein